MNQNKSVRSRLLALKPGGKMYFPGANESTVRTTASLLATLTGRRYSVRKGDNTFMVYRYE